MTKYYPALTPAGMFNHLMNAPFESFFQGPATRTSNLMTTDIRETDSAYVLEMDLPGFKKEDVTATLKDGYLTVAAKTEAKSEATDEAGTYLRKERFAGSCNRSFYVGEDIVQGNITAAFEDGVLKITVPKKEPVPVDDSPFAIAIA